MKKGILIVLAGVLLLLAGATAGAATYTWTGSVSGDWQDAGNWNPSGPPLASDTAVFDDSGSAALAVISAADWAARLGPERGRAEDYWEALFRRTYGAELRVEKASRAQAITAWAESRW